jgi:hypothetical protein
LESGFERAGIEREQGRALLDVLTLAKVNDAELPGDLCTNLDGCQGFRGADRRDGYRDGFRHDVGRHNRHRTAATCAATASSARAAPARTPTGFAG